jgi:pyruvate dehydrogenase E2 component (dihydrolipoamide acetyltransferase)
MAIQVIMPKVDMDQEESTIISWEKSEGDLVKYDELLLTAETDKVAIDVNSPGDGVLAGIRYQEGDVVPVATVIAYILEPGEELSDIPGATETKDAATEVEQVSADAPEADVDADVKVEAEVSTVSDPDGKVAATPAARRISREEGVALDSLKGSGPFGRIQADDVARMAPPSKETRAKLQAEIVPMVGKRAYIAQKMQSSFQTAPHIFETIEADMTRLEEWRSRLNANSDTKISVTAILVKLVAWALERNRYLNASLLDDGIHLWNEINVGVATAIDDGLIVPVIHDANHLSFQETASKLTNLSQKARQGSIELNEVQNGTFTISNLGMYGITHFRAIINPPEVAILAVGATVRKPVVIDQYDNISVRPMAKFTISADHRVIDGVVAAKFLADLVKVIENPEIFYE